MSYLGRQKGGGAPKRKSMFHVRFLHPPQQVATFFFFFASVEVCEAIKSSQVLHFMNLDKE